MRRPALSRALPALRTHAMRLGGVALLAASLSFASAAHASNAQAGYISEITIFADGTVLFNHDGSRDTPAACGAAWPARWAFNSASAAGQSRLSALLSAFGLHKRIRVLGLGNCSNWGDTESLNYFVITD